jgi:hypothetical protein
MASAFWRVLVVGMIAALLGWIGLTGLRARATRLTTTARAAAKTAVLLLKVYPMLPSRPLDWVTPRPVLERFGYPSSRGVEGDSPPGQPRRHQWWSASASCRWVDHAGAGSARRWRDPAAALLPGHQ